jgi:TetR/AcrR family transcriptional regulator, transcriptional repressor for nem operon
MYHTTNLPKVRYSVSDQSADYNLMTSLLSSRERVIQSSLNLFYAKGFHAVGTNQICSDAEVNKSTLYHLFPSKVDMVLAALEVYAGDVTRKFHQISRAKIPAEQKLEQIFEMPFDASQEIKKKLGSVRGCFVGNIALELAGSEERIRTYLAYIFQSWAEAIEPIVKELSGDKNVDTLRVASSIIAYLQGATLIAKAQNNPLVIKEFARSAIALVF